MKKEIKYGLFFFFLGAITFCCGTVFAYSLMANDVGFTSKDTSWKASNTKEALDDLRKNVGGSITGQIISYMGTKAPYGYLVCDGSTYNIEDYPKLAEQIKYNFGEYNHFGGDGETTFAVPDLRGEFLRGTGTGTRNTGSGAGVGVHQEPTQHLNLTFNQGRYFGPNTVYGYGQTRARNIDKNAESKTGSSTPYVTLSSGTDGNREAAFYTSRPTNTSVLYLIKY